MDLSAQRRHEQRQKAYNSRMQAGVCTRCGDPEKNGHLRAQCPHRSMVLNALFSAQADAAEDSGKE